MTTQKLRKIALLGSIGVSSFFAGSYFERKISNGPLTLKSYPALPIFGTVSAASVVSPVPYEGNVTRISQIMKYGFPSLDNIRSFDNYVLSYDKRNRVAHWVFEHITAENCKPNEGVDRSLCEFKPDESIHPYFRSLNSDYLKSGYDRGHLAAAGNHRSEQKLVDQTFYLSNMAPQVGVGFNRDAWNRLERYVRRLTRTYKNVYCCTGPLYIPRKESNGKNYVKYEVIGANHVAVPTHFFKVVVCEAKDGQLEMESYVMPNQVISDETPLSSFQVPPESIEKAAGLLFFDNISRSKISKINGKKN
ncbi:endonuclease G, mitochondrial [Asbolus verrucosus]|uniref:Endonuclease n=1 Tax=Asbolus verrucosus TaxID=1661398 RepID=A0A482VBK8_ASBVE|nr:endonuclease G, mitochondrial [Asbolus verrucosus]